MRANGLTNIQKEGRKDITKVIIDIRDYAKEHKTAEL
jgi:hypothetical protein